MFIGEFPNCTLKRSIPVKVSVDAGIYEVRFSDIGSSAVGYGRTPEEGIESLAEKGSHEIGILLVEEKNLTHIAKDVLLQYRKYLLI